MHRDLLHRFMNENTLSSMKFTILIVISATRVLFFFAKSWTRLKTKSSSKTPFFTWNQQKSKYTNCAVHIICGQLWKHQTVATTYEWNWPKNVWEVKCRRPVEIHGIQKIFKRTVDLSVFDVISKLWWMITGEWFFYWNKTLYKWKWIIQLLFNFIVNASCFNSSARQNTNKINCTQ